MIQWYFFFCMLAAGRPFFLIKKDQKIKAADFWRPTFVSIPKGWEAGPCGAF
jgi:hypothetical protein